MNALPLLIGFGLHDAEIGLRMLCASVMSHGGETPALFAFYSDLWCASRARPF